MFDVEYVTGHRAKSCFSDALQEESLSSREIQQSSKEPSSTQSWRRAVVASASLWSEATSQMSFYRSKVWCWTGLQQWMARWRQVQYKTTIHRGHCFHITAQTHTHTHTHTQTHTHTHTVMSSTTFIHFLCCLLAQFQCPLKCTQSPEKVHKGSGLSHHEFRNCIRGLWINFQDLRAHLPYSKSATLQKHYVKRWCWKSKKKKKRNYNRMTCRMTFSCWLETYATNRHCILYVFVLKLTTFLLIRGNQTINIPFNDLHTAWNISHLHFTVHRHVSVQVIWFYKVVSQLLLQRSKPSHSPELTQLRWCHRGCPSKGELHQFYTSKKVLLKIHKKVI